MAQLGDLERARALVRRAARSFGARETLARARCVVAEAEIALASRDLGAPAKTLRAARSTLQAHGDHANAAYAHYLEARRLLLIGQLEAAERALAELDPATAPPALQAIHELTAAGIALRKLRAAAARAPLERADHAARLSGIPALIGEVEAARKVLDAPAARLISRGAERSLMLHEVEALMASPALIVDACRGRLSHAGDCMSLARRPVLFALAQALAEAWPGDASRGLLLARAFGAKHVDESHRARLRVEIARLRAALDGIAYIAATRRGFAMAPRSASEVVVLARPIEEPHADVLALLSDGEAWSSSALALALGASQRTVQRALDALALRGKAQPFGRGRSRRWLTPTPGFATPLLLPVTPPID
jgi:hypothetical protein